MEVENLVTGIRPVTKYGDLVVGLRWTESGALLAFESRSTAAASPVDVSVPNADVGQTSKTMAAAQTNGALRERRLLTQ